MARFQAVMKNVEERSEDDEAQRAKKIHVAGILRGNHHCLVVGFDYSDFYCSSI